MKIQVTGSGNDINLTLPTKLIFSRFVLKQVLRRSGAAASVERIGSEAAETIIQELNRIQKRHGAWTLVEVQSADGEHVTITL